MAFDTWESYLYPPPHDQTLRNLFDERDATILGRLEYVETAERHRELLTGEVTVARTFDADHVCAIHRPLFQDIYPWAGQFRAVEMFTGVGRGFAEARGGEIERYLHDVHRLVMQTRGTVWTVRSSDSRQPGCSPTSTRRTRSRKATDAPRRCSWNTSPNSRHIAVMA